MKNIILYTSDENHKERLRKRLEYIPCCKIDKTKIRYVFDVGSHTEFFILDTKGKQIEEFKGL